MWSLRLNYAVSPEIFTARFTEVMEYVYLFALSAQITQRLVRLEKRLGNRMNDLFCMLYDRLRGQNAHSVEHDVKPDKF